MKEPNNYLNYHLSSFQINQSENFPFKINVEEVKNLSRKGRINAIRIVKSFTGTAISFLTLTSKSMANQLATTPTQQVANTGLPPDLIEPIMDLIKLALGGSILLTVLLLIAAGVMRQFRKKKEAAEWTTDIIKGFIQIIIATPLIFLMYYIVTKLLGNFDMFLNPF
ncbi:hypothetical protein [Bacillus sp. T33-2]|uniref:hypothetical protein n=1 Tax=Bacillus sp. T33-2 TaxID=2054168 RepID=UPI000C780625|nr:hypothetical protein [Bacillus sp. T33-2]PLR99625.1 hypothetical protein CVD19_00760 [Bacillus sp. T33-2]